MHRWESHTRASAKQHKHVRWDETKLAGSVLVQDSDETLALNTLKVVCTLGMTRYSIAKFCFCGLFHFPPCHWFINNFKYITASHFHDTWFMVVSWTKFFKDCMRLMTHGHLLRLANLLPLPMAFRLSLCIFVLTDSLMYDNTKLFQMQKKKSWIIHLSNSNRL